MGDDKVELDYARQNLNQFSTVCDKILAEGKPVLNSMERQWVLYLR